MEKKPYVTGISGDNASYAALIQFFLENNIITIAEARSCLNLKSTDKDFIFLSEDDIDLRPERSAAIKDIKS